MALAAVATGLAVTGDDGRARVAAEGGPPATAEEQPAPAASDPSTDVTTAPVAPQQAAPAPSAPGPCTPAKPGAAFPDARLGSLLVGTGDGVLIQGGRGSDFKDRTDTWVGGCSPWQRRQPSKAPTFEPGEAAAALHTARGEAVVLASGRTWVWAGGEWTNRGTGPRLGRVGLAYDSARQRVVAFGTGPSAAETWTWDGAAWTRVATSSAPEPREGGALVYDSVRHRTYLFGGGHEAAREGFTDTWAFDGTTWARLEPATSYPHGPVHAAFDAKRGVTVALAFNGVGHRAETWIFDGTTWRQAATTTTPTRRNLGAMTYVPALEQVLLFGGATNVYTETDAGPDVREEIVDDLWAWDGADWTRLH